MTAPITWLLKKPSDQDLHFFFSQWIILRTGGKTWYNSVFYTTYITLDLTHRAKVGKCGINGTGYNVSMYKLVTDCSLLL